MAARGQGQRELWADVQWGKSVRFASWGILESVKALNSILSERLEVTTMGAGVAGSVQAACVSHQSPWFRSQVLCIWDSSYWCTAPDGCSSWAPAKPVALPDFAPGSAFNLALPWKWISRYKISVFAFQIKWNKLEKCLTKIINVRFFLSLSNMINGTQNNDFKDCRFLNINHRTNK